MANTSSTWRRIDVARHDREEFNVFVRQRAGKTCGLADLQLVERAVFDDSPLRCSDALIGSAGSAHDVIAGVDKFDIPGKSRGAVASEEHGEVADLFDAHQQMFGSA